MSKMITTEEWNKLSKEEQEQRISNFEATWCYGDWSLQFKEDQSNDYHNFAMDMKNGTGIFGR